MLYATGIRCAYKNYKRRSRLDREVVMSVPMKTLSLIALWLSSFSVFAGPMTEIKSTDSLSAYIRKSGFNGVVLVGVQKGREKEVLFKKAFGYKNLNTGEPLTTADRFQIGSNTKQFVSAALLKLQEQGRLSLNDSVIQYLPQYKNKIQADITIRDLLNHTSGLTNYTDKKEFWENPEPEKILTFDDLIEFTLKYPLDFEPRSQWKYSNSGYIIAGKIIEELTGESWDQFIKNTFLIPMNMNDTGYTERFESVSEVNPHIKNESGEIIPYKGYNLSWALSAGALYSTVDDLFKWTSIYSDSPLLSEDSKAEMQTPFKEFYGLGILNQPYFQDQHINHGGRTVGFVSKLSFLKKAGLSVIRLDNIDGSVGGISELLMNYFTSGKALVVKLEKIQVPSEKLQDYSGRYKAGNFELNVFVKNDKLFLQPNDGQPAYELTANDTDSFNLGGFAGEEFIRDSSGKITKLFHYQNGHTSQFERQ